MALLFMDSFRHYGAPSHMADKWSDTIVADATHFSTGGRNDGAYMRLQNDDYATSTFSGRRTIVAGCRFRGYDTGSLWTPVMWFKNGVDPSIVFWLGGTTGGGYRPGNIIVTQGNLGGPFSRINSSVVFDISQWHYCEVKLVCYTGASANGYIEVRIDGVPVIEAGGISSAFLILFDQVTAAGIGGGVNVLGGHPIGDFCDFYVLDDTGPVANDFLFPVGGDVAVDYCPALGAGASQQSTIGGSAPAATRAGGVDELAPDDGTTYNAFTIDQKDLYTIDTSVLQPNELPTSMQIVGRHNKTSASTSKSRLIVRSHGRETESTDNVETLGYDYHSLAVQFDPKTGARISRKALDQVQIGFRKTG